MKSKYSRGEGSPRGGGGDRPPPPPPLATWLGLYLLAVCDRKKRSHQNLDTNPNPNHNPNYNSKPNPSPEQSGSYFTRLSRDQNGLINTISEGGVSESA